MDPISALLVVDDSGLRRHLTETLQANSDLKIEACSSGEEALSILGQRSFQIVYCDLCLGDMSGVVFTQKAQHQYPILI
jgi:DNA-binding NtrC family response regulator